MVEGFEELSKKNTDSISVKKEQEIRPLNFDEYVGQEELKKQLKIFIKAAKIKQKPLSHILLFGSAGLGKTTLATIIAHELGVNIHYASASVIEKPSDLASLLMQAESKDIIFIDEIHALHQKTEEFLHPAMEDFVLDITVQNGANNRPIRVPLEPFTLIGATTKPGALSKPFRDRFGIQQQLQPYTVDELQSILKRTARILNVECEQGALELIAKRSRSTARIANNLLTQCGDFAISENDSFLTKQITEEALNSLGIDNDGLNKIDRQLLITLFENFDNKPAGVKNIASLLQEGVETVESVIEPYLLQLGLIARTARGRQLTSKGLAYVKTVKR